MSTVKTYQQQQAERAAKAAADLAWRENLHEGDEVTITWRYNDTDTRLCKLTRRTPTQLVFQNTGRGEVRIRIADGKPIGYSSFRVSLSPVTDESRAQMAEQEVNRRFRDFVISQYRDTTVSQEVKIQILAILDTAAKHD